MTHRIFIYGPFALFVALALALSLSWWTGAQAFSRRLDALNGREAVVPGVKVHFGAKTVAGFPFRYDVTFTNLSVEIATPHGPTRWRSEKLALHRLTYGAARTLFEAAGRQDLGWTDEEGRSHAFVFAPGSMRASVSEDDAGVARFDLEVAGIGSPAFTAGEAQFHIRRDPTRDEIDVFATASDVRLAPALRSSLGDRIENFILAATVAPGRAADRLRSGVADWTEAVRVLQHANGAAHVDHLEIAFDRLAAEGKGTVALDGGFRPRGLLDVRIAHFAGFLARHPALDRNGKSLAAALATRAGVAGSDDMGRLPAVFGFSDGIVFLGDRPIGTLGSVF